MIDQLKQLGLTEYEAKVYEALLRLKTGTGGEIARKSGVPHGKTYESLHSLAEKGLITILPLEPKLFKLIEPEKAVKNLIERKKEIFEQNGKDFIESIKSIKSPLKEEAYEKIEIFQGKEKQFEIVKYLMNSAKKHLLIISKGEKVPLFVLQKSAEMTRRGIDIRLIVYQIEENQEWIKKLKSAMKTRHFKTGEFTLAIRDRQEFLLVVRNPKNQEDRLCLFFKDEAISNALAAYYEMIWKKAKEIKL